MIKQAIHQPSYTTSIIQMLDEDNTELSVLLKSPRKYIKIT